MRRPRRFGNSRSPSQKWTIPGDMASPPQSPRQSSIRDRDTGFPEPFCGSRNTSLPHPDAKIGPDACIGEDDVNVTRALLRHRMSFQVQTERRGSRSLSLHGRSLSGSSDEGTFSSLGRFAITSIREGVEPRSTSKEEGSVHSFSGFSDGNSSRSPDSPTQPAKVDPRDEVRDPRDGRRRRRKGSFIGRLLHR
ncbi:hypothetical protein QBC38DRAFT_446062 [Podospora fimiseda]|uniref:Uncharacterized protein n=1 Tax=Podospora fimiseda TaxID=252190 RepID=A0AAN7GUV9_9PEZI|nr:hypothetical protein QBC38DRAFT_446062 [Podospora fimiseda]